MLALVVVSATPNFTLGMIAEAATHTDRLGCCSAAPFKTTSTDKDAKDSGANSPFTFWHGDVLPKLSKTQMSDVDLFIVNIHL